MGESWAGRGWTLHHDQRGLVLATARGSEVFHGYDVRKLSVRRGLLGHSLVVEGRPDLQLPGLPHRAAAEVRSAIQCHLALAMIRPMLASAAQWWRTFDAFLSDRAATHRWINHDEAASAVSGHVGSGAVLGRLKPDEVRLVMPLLTSDDIAVLTRIDQNPWQAVARANAQVTAHTRQSWTDFLAKVERSPLTEEQIDVVLCEDSRIRVIAAAGSGKTSVLVARTAYTLARGLVPPEQILLLAFNNDAAVELAERVTSRCTALGIPSEGVKVATFHRFGLELIGLATGHKPRIAPWVENGEELAHLAEIIERLRQESPRFRQQWDVFRMLFGSPPAPEGSKAADSYDKASGRAGLRTFRGEIVRSEGECMIANFLFMHGVNYAYEHPYDHDVSDSRHGQYRPDFHYPDVGVWHEHWALDAEGRAPREFSGYRESMRWKKALHQRHGTPLIETTWHGVMQPDGLTSLATQLRSHGLELQWDADRPIPGAPPVEQKRIVQLMRTFMTHVKSNSLTREQVAARLPDKPTPRTLRFLELYWQVHDRWEADLREHHSIDFDDMLVKAADLLEQRPHLTDHRLVMVDEFQDASQARARLTRALLHGPGRTLLAVGDDWQSINRFAGADLSVMTDFARMFGPTTTLHLQTTFRSSQSISDVASGFVRRNPAQIHKLVRSVHPGVAQPVAIIRVAHEGAIPEVVGKRLKELGEGRSPEDEPVTVQVLGRYRDDQKYLSRATIKGVDVTYRTIHRSKGLEADHVILPRVTTGRRGFPSLHHDDSVLGLAMASSDGFPHSEERRLFYVALTRARHSVTLITVIGSESPFVAELLTDPRVRVESPDGTAARPCPACGQGVLVARTSQHGPFLGCSTFPACRHVDRGQPRAVSHRRPAGPS
ncbi:UvrD-helicase domain-containing protein [Aestuariimicrobium sp. T2.26MG-19.2B]|uniref:UvrD-helicase domain-containing protein n=1 Tax=Aestuariimicrobium sp. T2.26MG-19.2B TaxID=3040679 RepID=UPI0024779DC5|nr:UvrD-helicase domain-containing protein [Aestuariimicrobium sp. T2.26MG-19.2B]CAI9402734.1 ATP-dependent DNA helicase Rep [Aestuariimicrobium sp. T2.26MG-19.2B]